MARAKPQTTRHPGVYKRVSSKVGTVYDIKIGNHWVKGRYTNLREAADERARLVAEMKNGGAVPTRSRTFGDFAQDWRDRQQARATQGNLRSSTFNNYRRDLDGYLLPEFGDHRLQAVTPGAIQRFSDRLSAEGKANWTVRRIVATLSSVLELARKHGYIRHNPVADVEKPPAKRRREPVALAVSQVRKLADAAPTADDRNLILTAAFTGARIGELFGLRWVNVSLEPQGAETMLIAEQAYQGDVVDRPKTPTGRRLIDLGPDAAEALRAQHVESKRPNPTGLVFPSPDGAHQRQSNFTRRAWTTTRDAAGLPEVHFHDLRHFFVSHIRNAGLPTAITEQLVGHSDERTHRAYTQSIPGTEAVIREAMARAFKEDDDE
jgi:integrase